MTPSLPRAAAPSLVLASERRASGLSDDSARQYVLVGDGSGRLAVVPLHSGHPKAKAKDHVKHSAGYGAQRPLDVGSLRSVRLLLAAEARGVLGRAVSAVRRAYLTMRATAFQTFLPVDYPRSVPPEYLRYQCWDVCQNLASYLRGILATQSVLEGMGVGRAGSTALAATLQWMARDGASMVGGLCFTSLASSRFGTDIKAWRLFADVINDIGITLEMLAPRFPEHFLSLICLASVFKAMCGVSAGACNGAITEHWALRNNIADIGAKNGAQHTVVTLAGLSLGVWFARFANRSPSGVWISYAVLTFFHVYACLQAMRTLALRSLNPSRLSMLATNYLRAAAAAATGGRADPGGGAGMAGSGGGTDGAGGGTGYAAAAASVAAAAAAAAAAAPKGGPAAVLSLREVAAGEQLWRLPRWTSLLWPWGDDLQVTLGAALSDMVEEADDLLWLTTSFGEEEKFMATARVAHQTMGAKLHTSVAVALREDATPEDHARAYFLACIIHRSLVDRPEDIPGEATARKLFLRSVAEGSLRLTRREFPAFWEALARANWNLGRVTLGVPRYFCSWGKSAQGQAQAAVAGGELHKQD